MSVLFDTNVVLDALLDRGPMRPSPSLGATTITTVHYIARRNVGSAGADASMRDLLRLFEVAPVNRAVVEAALVLGFADLEDAILHEAGRLARVRAIVTRDPSGFSSATLRVYDPDTLVAALDAAEVGD